MSMRAPSGAYQHLSVDYYSSLAFSGGSVTLGNCPNLGTNYSIFAVMKSPLAVGTIYGQTGSGALTTTSTGQLNITGALTTTTTLRNREWCMVGMTCNGAVTTAYIDAEVQGAAAAAVPFNGGTGGAGTIQISNGGALTELRVYARALTLDEVRTAFYEDVWPAGAVDAFELLEGYGTTTLDTGSQASTATIGANVAWTLDVPKGPSALPIDSGSVIFDGSTNGHATPSAPNLAALAGLFGGTGLTISMWVKALGRGQTTKYPLTWHNGATLARFISAPDVVGAEGQWTSLRANSGTAPAAQFVRPMPRTVGQWMHIFGVADCPGGAVYSGADGVIQNYNNAAGVTPTYYPGSTVVDLRLGAGVSNAAGTNWAGQMADLRLYRRPLSRKELRDLWLGRGPADVDAGYRFPDAPGSASTTGWGAIPTSLVLAAGCTLSAERPR